MERNETKIALEPPTLTDFLCPCLIDRGAPNASRAAFFGAYPVALRKPDGVIRPIEKYKKKRDCAIADSPTLIAIYCNPLID